MDLLILVGIYLLSLIPSIAFYIWLRNGLFKGSSDLSQHQALCKNALVYGLLAVFAVFPTSALLNIPVIIMNVMGVAALPVAAYKTFFVLAAAEEGVKFYLLKRLMDKHPEHAFSWIELIAYMTCIGIGFELLESLVYAFGTGPMHMIVRGVTVMHCTFALIMGYFYGKARATGDKKYYALAFVVPWLLHGWYDFAISEAAAAVSDLFGFSALAIAILCLIGAVYGVFFLRKARTNKEYLKTVVPAKQLASDADQNGAPVAPMASATEQNLASVVPAV